MPDDINYGAHSAEPAAINYGAHSTDEAASRKPEEHLSVADSFDAFLDKIGASPTDKDAIYHMALPLAMLPGGPIEAVMGRVAGGTAALLEHAPNLLPYLGSFLKGASGAAPAAMEGVQLNKPFSVLTNMGRMAVAGHQAGAEGVADAQAAARIGMPRSTAPVWEGKTAPEQRETLDLSSIPQVSLPSGRTPGGMANAQPPPLPATREVPAVPVPKEAPLGAQPNAHGITRDQLARALGVKNYEGLDEAGKVTLDRIFPNAGAPKALPVQLPAPAPSPAEQGLYGKTAAKPNSASAIARKAAALESIKGTQPKSIGGLMQSPSPELLKVLTDPQKLKAMLDLYEEMQK